MKKYPAVICAEELEAIIAKGCQVPNCQHGDVHDKLDLVQRCCPGAGLKATAYASHLAPLNRPLLRLVCKQCGKDVAGLVVGKDSE